MNITEVIPSAKLQELETGQVLKQLKYIEMVLSFLHIPVTTLYVLLLWISF